MSVREHLAKILAQNVTLGNEATRNFVQSRGFTLRNGGFTLPKNGFALPKGGATMTNFAKLQGKGFVKEQMRENNKEIEKDNQIILPDEAHRAANVAVTAEIAALAPAPAAGQRPPARLRGRVRRGTGLPDALTVGRGDGPLSLRCRLAGQPRRHELCAAGWRHDPCRRRSGNGSVSGPCHFFRGLAGLRLHQRF